jgi:hypothetical protein
MPPVLNRLHPPKKEGRFPMTTAADLLTQYGPRESMDYDVVRGKAVQEKTQRAPT